MNELLKRSIFGLLFLAIVFGPYAADVRYQLTTFPIVLFLFSMIGTRELYTMSKAAGTPASTFSLSVLFGVLLFTPSLLLTLHSFRLTNFLPFPFGLFADGTIPVIFLIIQSLIIITFSLLIFREGDIKPIYKNTFLLSIVYTLLPFSMLATAYSYGKPGPLLLALVPIYLNDTLAYVTGRLFGKHKLIPSVSPKKTWEGFIGGIVGTAGLMNLLVWLLDPEFYDLNVALVFTLLSVLASVLATLGDLFESKLKRTAGVKDSGNILPGHGGILDRTDAMLFVAPVLYLLLQLIY